MNVQVEDYPLHAMACKYMIVITMLFVNESEWKYFQNAAQH